MIQANNLRNGTTFLIDNAPYKVIKYTFIKMGRGGATVRVKARNLLTSSVEEKSYSSAVKLDEVTTTKRELQYLYRDGENVVFMDPKSFDQIEVPIVTVADELPYVKEGQTAVVLFWESSGNQVPLSIEIAPKVTLKVSETVPGVKGNSATNVYKDATLENGLVAKVPLFIKVGDKVRIDTRTGEYVERVN